MKKLLLISICLFYSVCSFADEGILSEQYYSKHLSEAQHKITDCETRTQNQVGNINCINAQKSLNQIQEEVKYKAAISGASHVNY